MFIFKLYAETGHVYYCIQWNTCRQGNVFGACVSIEDWNETDGLRISLENTFHNTITHLWYLIFLHIHHKQGILLEIEHIWNVVVKYMYASVGWTEILINASELWNEWKGYEEQYTIKTECICCDIAVSSIGWTLWVYSSQAGFQQNPAILVARPQMFNSSKR